MDALLCIGTDQTMTVRAEDRPDLVLFFSHAGNLFEPLIQFDRTGAGDNEFTGIGYTTIVEFVPLRDPDLREALRSLQTLPGNNALRPGPKQGESGQLYAEQQPGEEP